MIRIVKKHAEWLANADFRVLAEASFGCWFLNLGHIPSCLLRHS